MTNHTDYKSAMRSYNAMETTKRRHFDFLTMLETRKKKFNLDATPAQKDLLASLLRDHDEEVRAFKTRCDELKVNNAAAHKAMFEYLAEINSALAPLAQTSSH